MFLHWDEDPADLVDVDGVLETVVYPSSLIVEMIAVAVGIDMCSIH